MNDCAYCSMEGVFRVPKGENVDADVYVCDKCWKLLKNPRTALPLLRGHLAMTLRGKIPEDVLNQTLNKYMEEIAKWKPRN